VLDLNPLSMTALANGSRVWLCVDHTDGGKLKVFIVGAPVALLFFWLTASAPFANAR